MFCPYNMYIDEPADLYLEDDEEDRPLSPYKTLEIDYKQFDFEEDDKCQNEFKRFLISILGHNGRTNKYLNGFIKLKSNDIRFVDPDILDNDLLKNRCIKMEGNDKKLFQQNVIKYKNDNINFEKILDEINMKDKYLKYFTNHGIATFWSFEYHIKCLNDIEKITKNKNDAMLIWKRFKRQNGINHNHDGIGIGNIMGHKNNPSFNDEPSVSVINIKINSNDNKTKKKSIQIEGKGRISYMKEDDMSSSDSDSEDMYTHHHIHKDGNKEITTPKYVNDLMKSATVTNNNSNTADIMQSQFDLTM